MINKIAVALVVFFLVQAVCLAKDPPVINDDTITDQVRIKLAGDPVVKGGGLEVKVAQGVVTITGSVDTDKARDRAEKVAKKVKGVKQVIVKVDVKTKTGK
jgi:osmotically-inducible protein OsmY